MCTGVDYGCVAANTLTTRVWLRLNVAQPQIVPRWAKLCSRQITRLIIRERSKAFDVVHTTVRRRVVLRFPSRD